MTNNKLRVGVIFGGKSGEHEVSLVSAQNVMDAMDKSKYEIAPIGITKAGLWLSGERVMKQLAGETTMPPQLTARAVESARSLVSFLDDSVAAKSSSLGALDVIFPVLHGPMGEDGTAQGLFELADLPYVGCGVTASAAAMDKALAKDIFKANGLPVLPHLSILRKDWQRQADTIIAKIEAELSYPVFVKPANMGSSVGINKADNAAELRLALDEAAQFDRRLIVEQGIAAREIEVSVLGNDDPIASAPGEVIPSREFYSYAAKYIDDSSDLLIPAPLTPAQSEAFREMAARAFQALDGAGLARVDFLMDKESGQIYLNEINTMPGFTAISMYPKLWEASGISYADLIDRLIELALERHTDKQQTTSFFDVSNAA
ncbi:MAG TPA: D-alanine--D-alanine ligase [Chloroflexi bacterium]|nr:D-alanine--D-alanine ligase [Chloroflexota bacterium]